MPACLLSEMTPLINAAFLARRIFEAALSPQLMVQVVKQQKVAALQ